MRNDAEVLGPDGPQDALAGSLGRDELGRDHACLRWRQRVGQARRTAPDGAGRIARAWWPRDRAPRTGKSPRRRIWSWQKGPLRNSGRIGSGQVSRTWTLEDPLAPASARQRAEKAVVTELSLSRDRTIEPVELAQKARPFSGHGDGLSLARALERADCSKGLGHRRPHRHEAVIAQDQSNSSG
jgi:hypothetical protein